MIGCLVGHWVTRHKAPRPLAQAESIGPAGERPDGERRTIQLFENASPGIVNITVATRQRDPWSRRTRDVPAGTGSGFVWDTQGHIVTNYHVIQNANAAAVTFVDGTTLPARLVGASPDHDLAVLKTEPGAVADEAAALPIGESQTLRVGQSVYAIGSPFGLNHTLTTGVVSAMDRTITSVSGRPIEGVIQTDTAINPGNSGGPLLDSSGRVIAVNTAIYSPSGASAGIGFAVPIDTAKRVVPRLIADGRYAPPQLGVYAPDSLTHDAQRRFNVAGIVIAEVLPDTPAAAAGLRGLSRDAAGRTRLGDVLQAVNGQPVRSLNDLFLVLDPLAAGQTVTLTILRNGDTIQREVTLR